MASVPIVQQRKRSILKHESFDVEDLANAEGGNGSGGGIMGQSRLKGVLKKDSSYDDGLKPILKNYSADEDAAGPWRRSPTSPISSPMASSTRAWPRRSSRPTRPPRP